MALKLAHMYVPLYILGPRRTFKEDCACSQSLSYGEFSSETTRWFDYVGDLIRWDVGSVNILIYFEAS